MTISTPRDALVHGLASALEAVSALAGVRVYRGWPADETFGLPAISVSASSGVTSKRSTNVYRETTLGGGIIETLYEIERRTFNGSVELWAESKTLREPLELAVDALFAGAKPNDLGFLEPPPPGIELVLANLYDAKVRVRLVDVTEQDASGGRDGYVRTVFSFSCDVPYLVRMEHNPANWSHTTTVIDIE